MNCVKTQQRIKRSNWLLNQPVGEVLRRLSTPMLPAIFAIMALDLFDAYLISQLGTESLAALSFTIPVTSALFAVAIGLSIGIASVLSFVLGKGEHLLAKRLITDSLLIACIVAIIIAVVGLLTIELLFVSLGANYALIPESYHLGPGPDIMPLISDYMALRYSGFVFMLVPLIVNSIMRSTGDSIFAGRLMFCWAGFTALVDGVLMILPGEMPSLVSIGVGHLIADVAFSVISIWVLTKYEKLIDLGNLSKSSLLNNGRNIFRIGLPACGMNLLIPLGMAVVTSWISFYGREAIAAFGVLTRIESVALFVPMVLTTSLPVFVGQNFGAGQFGRSNTAISHCVKVTIFAQVAVYFSLLLLAQPLADLFSDSSEVSNLIADFLTVLPLGFLGQGIVILVVSAFNAMHQPRSAFLLSLIRMFGLFVPMAYFGDQLAGLDGLIIFIMFANLLVGLIAYLWFNKFADTKVKLIEDPI